MFNQKTYEQLRQMMLDEKMFMYSLEFLNINYYRGKGYIS
jgi:hypothetical protein